MITMEILPLCGVCFDGKTLALGMSPEQVTELLGEPESRHGSSAYYFGACLRLDFDAENRVEFLEFLGGERLCPVIFGYPVYGTDAAVLYEALAERNGGDILDRENGYSYGFCSLGLGLWREEPDADRWTTLGMGTREYYTA